MQNTTNAVDGANLSESAIQPSNSTSRSTPSFAFAAGITGMAEAIIFHGPDTISKRLMNHHRFIGSTMVRQHGYKSFSENFGNVVWPSGVNKSFTCKIKSVYPGLKFTIQYKVLERASGLTGQRYIADQLERRTGKVYRENFGNQYGKILLEATAGTMIGVLQAFTIIPFDAIRTKAQTNPKLIKNKSTWQILKSENIFLWNGVHAVACRNSYSAPLMFGMPYVVYQFGFGMKDFQEIPFHQRLVANSTAGISMALMTNWIDVIKTRVQAEHDAKFTRVLVNSVRDEGYRSLFKGFVPRVSIIAPKISFTLTAAPQVEKFFSGLFKKCDDVLKIPNVQCESKTIIAQNINSKNHNFRNK